MGMGFVPAAGFVRWPPLLHMTTLTTARSRISRRLHKPTRSESTSWTNSRRNLVINEPRAPRRVQGWDSMFIVVLQYTRDIRYPRLSRRQLNMATVHMGSARTCGVNHDRHAVSVFISGLLVVAVCNYSAVDNSTCIATTRVKAWLTAHIPYSD